MPMNSMPQYMARPKAARVAIMAETLPIRPRNGLERTASPIMQVMMLKGQFPIRRRLEGVVQHLPEQAHEQKSGAEVGHNSLGILLQLVVQSTRGEV